MTYSAILTKFAETYPEILTNPEKYLGPNAPKVLEFWEKIENLSVYERKQISDLYFALDYNARNSAGFAAWNAAADVFGREFSSAAWYAARDVTGCGVFGYATDELIGEVETKVFYNLIVQNSSKSETMSPELTEQLKIYQENLKQIAANWLDASLTAKNAGLQKLAADFKMKEIECKKTIAIISQTISDFTSPLASEYIRNTKIVEIPTPIISKTLSKLAETYPEVLTNPEKYLGPNYQDVLNFWIYIDTLSEQEREEMYQFYCALNYNVRKFAIIASRNAAVDVVGEEFGDAAWCAAWDLTEWRVFGFATLELIGDVENKLCYDLIMSHKKS